MPVSSGTTALHHAFQVTFTQWALHHRQGDSQDGFSFTVYPQPFLLPSTDGIFAEYEAFGSRTSEFARRGRVLLTYSAYSRHGVRIALARTGILKKLNA